MMRTRTGGSAAGGSTGAQCCKASSCTFMLLLLILTERCCMPIHSGRLYLNVFSPRTGGRYYDDEDDDDVYATRESRNGGARGDRGAIGQSSRSEADPMEATRWEMCIKPPAVVHIDTSR